MIEVVGTTNARLLFLVPFERKRTSSVLKRVVEASVKLKEATNGIIFLNV